MFGHVHESQFTAKPEKPDALYAMKFQAILGEPGTNATQGVVNKVKNALN